MSAASAEERRLHDRLVAGEMAALGEVYDRFAPVVFQVALRLTGDRGSAQDITQIVFVEMWNHPDRFDPGRGSLRTWLATVAGHRSVDWVRAEVARRRRDERVLRDNDRVEQVDDLVDATLLRDKIREVLAALPARERVAIVLAFFGGRTYLEVAHELGLPAGTVKAQIRAGLRRMIDVLDRDGYGMEDNG